MASFECSRQDVEERTFQKFPIRRLEPSIKKFLKVIQIDLQRLHQHKQNIDKFITKQDVANLNTEQINATRTVQQIKANVHEIEKSRQQVLDEDLPKFDEKIQGMKTAALSAVAEVLSSPSDSEREGDTSHSEETTPSSDIHPLMDAHPLTDSHPLMDGWSGNKDDTQLSQETRNVVLQETQVAESWEGLKENLEDLNVLIHQFSSAVKDQQEHVDRIEDNIDHAHMSVQEGTSFLGKAAKFKTAIIPLAGAAIGTVAFGPIGFVAGAKIGALAAAAGGGTIGFLGGRKVKQRQDQVTEVELSNLSAKRSVSESDTGEVKQNEDSWFSWLPWNSSNPEKENVEQKETADSSKFKSCPEMY